LAFEAANAVTSFPLKGVHLTIPALIGHDRDLCARVDGGSLVVCRLSPADYHRFHFPADGALIDTFDLPGRYDSVNPVALERTTSVLHRNHRRVNRLRLTTGDDAALVEVGAFGVGKIVATHEGGAFRKMDEKGYFKFGGSSIVLVFPPGRVRLADDLLDYTRAGHEVRLLAGETIGELLESPP
jgi:phosphatidylserine decarboxylase